MPDQPANFALRIDNITKAYSSTVSVGPISFDVQPGEFLSLLGPSGCGKTTTLRCIAGFETITTGAIWLGTTCLDRIPAHKRDLGFVFQQYALFPHLSVFENVAFGLRLARINRDEIRGRVLAMLETVELTAAARRFPSEISGGQQQRVAIARAMVLEPKLMLFDEPLSNLDLKLRIQMRQELRKLQRRLGKTTIYVTHDQTEALALSDRIAVLSQGRIEQIGTPKEIYERPATPFVADFMGSANFMPARVIQYRSRQAILEFGPSLHLVADVGESGPAAGVVAMVRPEHIHLDVAGVQISHAANCYQAQVIDVAYLGENLSLTVRIGKGTELVATVKATSRNQALSAAQTVTIGFSPTDVHLLAS